MLRVQIFSGLEALNTEDSRAEVDIEIPESGLYGVWGLLAGYLQPTEPDSSG